MGKITAGKYIKDQFTTLPTLSSDLTGRTVIVIGANVGLGLEASRKFARMNPGRLILGCRNMEKAEGAVQDIKESTGCETVEPWVVDLSDFKSVVAFADRYDKEGGDRLDLLIMNAGVNFFHYTKTTDNWETILQVNHLSTCLLTLRLLPYLKKAPVFPPTPRIVIVSSETHYFLSKLREAKDPRILESLNDPKYCAKMRTMEERYWITKLFNLFFVHSLADRLPKPSAESPGLIVTSVNPGWCKSKLMRSAGIIRSFALNMGAKIMARTTEEGSRTLVWAALACPDGGIPLHGHYTATCRVEEESDYSLSEEGKVVRERVWDETLEVLTKVDPSLDGIVKEHLNPVSA
ncbi:hypothetical protein M422DRAFT_64871 [Sphaerobolus stellatus SS14]|nr:hypothetical protein M422DRAFT_64871 [Sphaerobolus stellatus SS14]